MTVNLYVGDQLYLSSLNLKYFSCSSCKMGKNMTNDEINRDTIYTYALFPELQFLDMQLKFSSIVYYDYPVEIEMIEEFI